MSSRAYDDERLAGAYEQGNEMPEASLRAWVELFASAVPGPASAIVEVGAGTGMFSAAMARWIEGAGVLAVDPSEAMLSQARRHHPHPAVRYVTGSAEAVPARAGSFDLALLSRVIHHIPDRPRAVRELARVVRPGGRVVVRTTFRERLDAAVYDYWPPLRAVDEQRFPSGEDVVADFTGGGFAHLGTTSFAQPVTASLADYHDRLATQPQSKFAHLTPDQFRTGLRRLEAAARTDGSRPVLERYDVAVFARTP
ncbi:class I SAM-dependent methyltransferase [Actinacidiphila bryophytorum]|uniref:class I SAM-dependent methyltransferase n=1 Tax=Actinacidiphila bryophytorum TaxID=1436133 RepID=UPI002176D126|nr:class I SAM-dependent methyltransferase [Actinacidiphila bryophytorum]UWE10370.1 methyltransferase domain-containing protein [Actinacidiphila bryophytorum]